MILELIVTWGLPAVMPDHSLLNDYISTAGATDAANPAAFAMLGIIAVILHLFFVAGLWWQRDDGWHRATVLLFAAFFVLLGVSLGFQCDPGCAVETREAIIHTVLGILAFACLGVAALVHAVSLWLRRQHKSAVFRAAIALIAADLLLLLGYSLELFAGLVERLTIIAMMAWSVLWMVRLTAPAWPSRPAKPAT